MTMHMIHNRCLCSSINVQCVWHCVLGSIPLLNKHLGPISHLGVKQNKSRGESKLQNLKLNHVKEVNGAK